MRDLSGIIVRLKEKFNLKNDTQVANLLSVEQNTLSSWKTRNKIPYEKLDELSINSNLSLDWILSGKNEFDKYQEMISYLEKLPSEKREIYFLRIKADAIELSTL